ncbi:hypothetical protein L1987_82119 [Smallanthus sonchifolius]|uniref:Uncharacterized protein n=1 Tax=Smallanthus sonchifolius TaxID=185202 RepID=A0ACB8YT07_9ASTR|nr:hypothetical protein L1987_82119 [Smallanthus sonchifolius]
MPAADHHGRASPLTSKIKTPPLPAAPFAQARSKRWTKIECANEVPSLGGAKTLALQKTVLRSRRLVKPISSKEVPNNLHFSKTLAHKEEQIAAVVGDEEAASFGENTQGRGRTTSLIRDPDTSKTPTSSTKSTTKSTRPNTEYKTQHQSPSHQLVKWRSFSWAQKSSNNYSLLKSTTLIL